MTEADIELINLIIINIKKKSMYRSPSGYIGFIHVHESFTIDVKLDGVTFHFYDVTNSVHLLHYLYLHPVSHSVQL